MFALSPIEITSLIAVVCALEIALFWAAAALGDAPLLGWRKILLVSLAATAATAAVGGGIAWSVRTVPLLDPDYRLLAVVLGLLALLITWVIPGVLYAPLVPVSIPRGMFISVVQVLLRVFLYVLIAAVVMVALAAFQIWRGADSRVEVPAVRGATPPPQPPSPKRRGGNKATPPPQPPSPKRRGGSQATPPPQPPSPKRRGGSKQWRGVASAAVFCLPPPLRFGEGAGGRGSSAFLPLSASGRGPGGGVIPS
jgi:hypothetical protein